MSCGSCGTSSNGLPKGCKNNGACGVGSGCGKLPVFDWLSNMRLPNGQEAFNCVEVRFKNDRKLYYKNINNLTLSMGDVVAVEAQSGHDIGVVTLTGELVRIQMKKRRLTENSEDVKKIYRKANEKDIDTWRSYQDREKETMMKARRIAVDLGLEMKISDVEYQGDGNKATFYYTAEGRVDFRELIKQYATNFSVRIEMKQIGYRQEAAKVGGIGSCGRELCCSTWLTDFRSVNTAAARYQQLSINPQKLAGQCGKLKCCLNYELDSYLDALENMPSMESTFKTEKGTAFCVKVDVFKKEMWFTYETNSANWFKFNADQVQEFIEESKAGNKILPLEELAKELLEEKKSVDVIEENSLERFENKNKKRKRTPKNFKKEPQEVKNNDNKPAVKKPNDNKKPFVKKNKPQRTDTPKPEQKQSQKPVQKQEQKPVQKQNKPQVPNNKKSETNVIDNQEAPKKPKNKNFKKRNNNKRGPQNNNDKAQ